MRLRDIALVLAVGAVSIGSIFVLSEADASYGGLASLKSTTTSARQIDAQNARAVAIAQQDSRLQKEGATTASTRWVGCGTPAALVGMWEETDGEGQYSIEFRADGTYAERRDNYVAVFVESLRAFDFQNADATTTGNWAIVTDRTEEAIEYAARYSTSPPLRLPGDGVILKQDFGRGPFYYKVTFENGCEVFAQTPTWIQEDEPGYFRYEYRRSN